MVLRAVRRGRFAVVWSCGRGSGQGRGPDVGGFWQFSKVAASELTRTRLHLHLSSTCNRLRDMHSKKSCTCSYSSQSLV